MAKNHKGKFVRKDDIPILDEHDILDDKGNVVMKLDARMLQRIIDNNNARVKQTGDETPIVIGHTDDDVPEDEQPEIVGWADKFYLGDLYETGKKAIFCSAKFMADKIGRVKQFPRRSVELWLQKLLIDPISLLGASTPERDLGLLKFSSGGDKTYNHLFPRNKTMDQPNEIVAQVLSALQETKAWKWLESQAEAESVEEPEDDGILPDEEGLEDLPLGDEEVPLDEDVEVDVDLDEGLSDEEGDEEVHVDINSHDDEEEPQRYGAGAPSGTNTSVPSWNEQVKRMKKEQGRTRKVRLSAALSTLKRENRDLRLKFRAAERERDLVQLEAEGFLFDRAEELESLLPLNEKAYKTRLSLLRKRYQKAPIGANPYFLATPVTDRSAGRERSQAIVEYATAHNISYADAARKMEGEKVM